MPDEEWYWNLSTNEAVPASRRSRAEVMLGPYPTREAAENWQSATEARNEAWEEQDAEWAGEDTEAESDDGGA